MKEGDIVMIFVDPIDMEFPVGEARLVKCQEGHGICEMWTVEYLHQPGHLYNVLIKVNDGKN